LPQLSAFAHNCRPVARAKDITAKPYRVSDQLTVSQVRQSGDEWCIDQPTSEVCSEPAVFVIKIPINKSHSVFQEVVVQHAVSRA
jgi:hypothetical protein